MSSPNLVERAQTEGVATAVFAPKENETLHVCVNYCKLNAVAERDFYSMPRTDDYTDLLQKPKNLSPYTLAADTGILKLTEQLGTKLSSPLSRTLPL